MENRINIHEKVVVVSEKHPLRYFRGRVVSIKGEIEEGNNWILVFIPNKGKNFLIPENYLQKE
jgi:hypothetical protein